MPTAEELYAKLKPFQESKGRYFNRDTASVLWLLEALLKKMEQYGYMSCPCRLASGDREKDKAIFCPCIYCDADIKEYDSCYCGLYVSKAYNERPAGAEPAFVPDRHVSLA